MILFCTPRPLQPLHHQTVICAQTGITTTTGLQTERPSPIATPRTMTMQQHAWHNMHRRLFFRVRGIKSEHFMGDSMHLSLWETVHVCMDWQCTHSAILKALPLTIQDSSSLNFSYRLLSWHLHVCLPDMDAVLQQNVKDRGCSVSAAALCYLIHSIASSLQFLSFAALSTSQVMYISSDHPLTSLHQCSAVWLRTNALRPCRICLWSFFPFWNMHAVRLSSARAAATLGRLCHVSQPF